MTLTIEIGEAFQITLLWLAAALVLYGMVR